MIILNVILGVLLRMTQTLPRIIASIDALADDVDQLEAEILDLCKKTFCDALREHSDLNNNIINRLWLQYEASELKFKV